MIAGPLAWLGARAQWVLALGVISALFVPGLGALLSGTLAFWVTLLFGLSMMRIDLIGVARRAMSPRRLARNLALCAGLMIAMPVVIWAAATAVGLPQAHVEALVYTMAAPPLGSGAAFCLILGFNAGFAIEMTVLSSMVAPATMPMMARVLLGDAVPVDTAEMAGRLALVIGLGCAGALVARYALGTARIERHRLSFDGLAAVLLVVFLFPLFDGLTETIVEAPLLATGIFALAVLANLGVQIAAIPATSRLAGPATGGAAALIMGNRNAALALASVPGEPIFALFVALYQFPMYFTPLVMRQVVRL